MNCGARECGFRFIVGDVRTAPCPMCGADVAVGRRFLDVAGGSSRLARFEKSRFIGARDTMTVYDCDDAGQLARLEARVEADDLVGRNLIQSFAPDHPGRSPQPGVPPARLPPGSWLGKRIPR